MVDLFSKRLIINTGKGGVGKTTLSAAIALAASRKGKRVLVMELNAKDKFARLFGAKHIGNEPVEVEENLFAVNVTPQAALEEYAILKLKLKTLYKAVFQNRFVKTFLNVIPGLTELVLLGKAWYEERAVDSSTGRPRWDLIVVDAPATGHGIFFLKIPSVITGAISSGPMYDESRKIQSLIEDPKRTALNLITLVEEMPVNETIELKQQTEQSLNVPLGFVIANAVYDPFFSAQEASLMEHVRTSIPDDDSRLDRLLDAGLFRHSRVTLQKQYLQRLDNELDLPRLTIPYYFTERFDFMTISKIADAILEQTSSSQRSESP